LFCKFAQNTRNGSLKTYIKRESVITDECIYKTSWGQTQLTAAWNRADAAQMGVSGQSSLIKSVGGEVTELSSAEGMC